MAFDRLRRESGSRLAEPDSPAGEAAPERTAAEATPERTVAKAPPEPTAAESPVAERSIPPRAVEVSREEPSPPRAAARARDSWWFASNAVHNAAQRESYSALLDTIRSIHRLRGPVPYVVLAGASRAEAVDDVVAGLVETGLNRGLRVVALELATTADGRELRAHRASVIGREILAPLDVSSPTGAEEVDSWLRTALERFDVVLVEAPPLGDSADGALLGRVLDGLFVVAEQGRTRGDQLKTATQRAKAASSAVHGLVLTQSRNHLPNWLTSVFGASDV